MFFKARILKLNNNTNKSEIILPLKGSVFSSEIAFDSVINNLMVSDFKKSHKENRIKSTFPLSASQ